MTGSYKINTGTKGVLYTLLGAFLFTVTTALSKEVTPDTNALYVTFFRNFFGLLILILIQLGTKGFAFPKPQVRFRNHLLRAVLGVGATVCLFQSFSSLPLQNATALTFTGPFFTAILAIFLLKEKANLHVWLALCLGFLGVLLILNVSVHISFYGFAFGIAAAALNASALVVIKSISAKEDSFVVVYYYTALATVISALWMPFNWYAFSLANILYLLALAATSVSAHYAIAKGLSFAPASKLSPLNYTSLLWATLIGILIWDERITMTGLAGCAVITLSGLWLIANRGKTNGQKPV